jgi:hypothetical protein
MKFLLNQLSILFLLLTIQQQAFCQTLEVDSSEYIAGTALQGGIGNYGDPTIHHGFTLSMNGGIGISKNQSVFGYDAFAINSRWVPGTNNVGRRIIITAGISNWFTPALSEIYSDTVLTMSEKLEKPITITNFMAGIAFNLLKERHPKEEDFKPFKGELDTLSQKAANAVTKIDSIEIEKEYKKLSWQIVRHSMRKPSWIIGSSFRLTNLEGESNIDVFDLYSSFSIGKGIFDFTLTNHFISAQKNISVFKNAFTTNFGFFIDLDDNPPVNTLGIIFGYGYYNYNEKNREIIKQGMPNIIVNDKPLARRFDITLIFSNLFKSNNLFGNGFGIRYSRMDRKNFPLDNQISILFSTQFVSNSQKK